MINAFWESNGSSFTSFSLRRGFTDFAWNVTLQPMSTTKASHTDQALPLLSEWRTFGGEALLSVHGYPELLEKLEYLNDAQRAKVELAYRFATFAHDGQLRKSGEPYITHPVAVAAILAGLQPDVETLLAGLLRWLATTFSSASRPTLNPWTR